jgi:hypothetical protein
VALEDESDMVVALVVVAVLPDPLLLPDPHPIKENAVQATMLQMVKALTFLRFKSIPFQAPCALCCRMDSTPTAGADSFFVAAFAL